MAIILYGWPESKHWKKSPEEQEVHPRHFTKHFLGSKHFENEEDCREAVILWLQSLVTRTALRNLCLSMINAGITMATMLKIRIKSIIIVNSFVLIHFIFIELHTNVLYFLNDLHKNEYLQWHDKQYSINVLLEFKFKYNKTFE